MRFKKITLVGIGLLGGSLGLAVRQRRLAGEIAGYVRRPEGIAQCEQFAAADYATTDLLAAVSGADLVILCTPLAQMTILTRQFLPALKRGAIVTDVGSVKGGIVRELQTLVRRRGAHFIGSHPMAGGEKTGVAAARADLFEHAVCVVTPTKKTEASALRKVEGFWKSLGADVMRMPPESHDTLVSRSSHLPHLAAAALAHLVLNPRHPRSQAALCANGFRDTTRIASGSPEMWRDITLANRKPLSRSLAQFIRDLQKFQHSIQTANSSGIMRFFETAKHRRDLWISRSASISPE